MSVFSGGTMPNQNAHSYSPSNISYHNKDIFSKIFSENMRNKSLSAYGLQLPKIVDILPTNLPVIEANEMRLDNIFKLDDGSLALIDYESVYKHKNKIKYLNYVVRALKKNDLIDNIDKPIRMIVIYTGDVKRSQTNPHLDVGCLQFTIEEVFLSELNPYQIEELLTYKINAGIPLSEEEQMQFIILPMIFRKKKDKQACIRRCFDLSKKIEATELQQFLLCGLLVFTDKIISKQDSEQIWRWLDMTKVGRIFERELQKAVQIEVEKEVQKTLDVVNKEKQEALDTANKEKQEALKSSTLTIARRMLTQGIPISTIQNIIPELTYSEINALTNPSN